MSLFERRSEEVKAHNSLNRGWVKAVNKFADFTDEEFHGMLGHRLSQRGRSEGAAPPAYASSFLMLGDRLAETVDYRSTLNASLQVKDQGGCGSCWAVAVAGAMETHTEHHHKGPVPPVSFEQLVDCVENPDECGGKGGCTGATAELAMDYVSKHPLAAKSDYKGYQTGSGEGECKTPENPVISIEGFVRLSENKLQPLLEALATQGPVVVSADAGPWGAYSSGVFDSCDKDATINHAILAMGYGNDATLNADYWLIRNSWGADWGEGGFIRLLRHSGDDYCGTDRKPLDGVGSKGGPATLPVCGMCGVLSDSAYPTGVALLQQKLV